MKVFPPGFAAALAAGSPPAMLLTITCANGVIQRFTDYSADISYIGNTYYARGGIKRSAITLNEGLDSSNMDIMALYRAGYINRVDIVAGLYRGALVQVALCIPKNPSITAMLMMEGNIGEANAGRIKTTMSVHSLSDLLTMANPRITSPTCPYKLGDSNCTKDISSLIISTTVSAIGGDLVFSVPVALTNPNVNAFNVGKVLFTSGENNGLYGDISSVAVSGSVSVITLFLPVGYTTAVGDGVTITPGCDNNKLTCQNVWNNYINFGGQPDVPGIDQMNNATQT